MKLLRWLHFLALGAFTLALTPGALVCLCLRICWLMSGKWVRDVQDQVEGLDWVDEWVEQRREKESAR